MTDARFAEGTATAGTTVLVGKRFRVRKGRGRRFEKEPPKEPEERPARIALQMALAYRIQGAIDAGEIRDQAEAARRLGLTRARVSQLLDLTMLAPDIQESLLLLERSRESEPLSERPLRPLLRTQSWASQRTRLGSTTFRGPPLPV